MMNDKHKLLTAVAMTLVISGCDSSDTGGITDSQMVLDDPVTAGGATSSEVTVNTQTSTSQALPVMPLSSSQMDAFVKNPLIASIPAELDGSSTNVQSRRYITNPLIN